MVCLDQVRRASTAKERRVTRTSATATVGCPLDALPMQVEKPASVLIGQRCRNVMASRSSASNMASRVSSCQCSDSRRQFGDAVARASTARGTKSVVISTKIRAKSSPPKLKFQTRSLHSARTHASMTSREAGVMSRCSLLSQGGVSSTRHSGPSGYRQDLVESFRLPLFERSGTHEEIPRGTREVDDIRHKLKQANDDFFVRKIRDDVSNGDDAYANYLLMPTSRRTVTSSRPQTGKRRQLSAVRRLLRQSELQLREETLDAHLRLTLHSTGKDVLGSFDEGESSESEKEEVKPSNLLQVPAITVGKSGRRVASSENIRMTPRSAKSSRQSKLSARFVCLLNSCHVHNGLLCDSMNVSFQSEGRAEVSTAQVAIHAQQVRRRRSDVTSQTATSAVRLSQFRDEVARSILSAVVARQHVHQV